MRKLVSCDIFYFYRIRLNKCNPKITEHSKHLSVISYCVSHVTALIVRYEIPHAVAAL